MKKISFAILGMGNRGTAYAAKLLKYSQEAEVIQSALTGKEKTGPAICTLVISPGEPVEPLSGYKNLSDWSAEDLLLLITRLGQLIGIKLA